MMVKQELQSGKSKYFQMNVKNESTLAIAVTKTVRVEANENIIKHVLRTENGYNRFIMLYPAGTCQQRQEHYYLGKIPYEPSRPIIHP
ncbi:MAG: chlorite dismutase [Desulforhopalus sp.]|jgi:chlorite dismutase